MYVLAALRRRPHRPFTPPSTSLLCPASQRRDATPAALQLRQMAPTGPASSICFLHCLPARSTATAVGRGALGTASRGLEDKRRVVVLTQERAQRVSPLDTGLSWARLACV